jgi:hypothetical protein
LMTINTIKCLGPVLGTIKRTTPHSHQVHNLLYRKSLFHLHWLERRSTCKYTIPCCFVGTEQAKASSAPSQLVVDYDQVRLDVKVVADNFNNPSHN